MMIQKVFSFWIRKIQKEIFLFLERSLSGSCGGGTACLPPLGSCTTWREACGLRLLMFTLFIRASEFSKLQTNFAGNLKSAADFPAEVYEMRKYKVSLQQSKVEKCTLDCTFTAYKVLIQ